MRRFKPRRLYEVGQNLRSLREELGLSLRDVARVLKIDPKEILNHENNGFQEPPWVRYLDVYRNHPDIRDKDSLTVLLLLCSAGLLTNSKLYKQLISIYGRDKLEDALAARTNEDVIVELQEKVKAWEWKIEDVDCIRRRIGLLRPITGWARAREKRHPKKKN